VGFLFIPDTAKSQHLETVVSGLYRPEVTFLSPNQQRQSTEENQKTIKLTNIKHVNAKHL